MWIMIIKRIPTDPSPPVFGIFWSTAWPMEDRRSERVKQAHESFGWGREPDADGARRVHYKGVDVRVFPHEFSTPTREVMHELLQSNAYTLVAEGGASDTVIEGVLDGVSRPIYEAAALDGANEQQAMATAIGVDVTLPDAEYPPVGWYKCRREYQEIYYDDWQISE